MTGDCENVPSPGGRPEARDASVGFAVAVCAVLGVAAILVSPLWFIDLLPMSDFPAHVAALFIQMHAASDPVLSRLYEIDWAPVPDLASELIVPLFSGLPAIPATKLFLSVAVMLWVCGPVAVRVRAAPVSA